MLLEKLRDIFFGDLQERLLDCEIRVSDLRTASANIATNCGEVRQAMNRVLSRDRITEAAIDSLREDLAKLDLRWVGINKRLDECKCPPASVTKEIEEIKNWLRVLHAWTVKISDRVSAFTPAPQQPPPEPYEASDA